MDSLPYDPRRAIAAHKAQERNAWDRYAASVLIAKLDEESIEADAAFMAAKAADAMLAERRKRFPGPRFARVEEDDAP